MAMRVSTKGRYALRVMIDIAENDNGDYVSLSSIAERQMISEKYLEAIVAPFAKEGLVEGKRGKSGGYKLAIKPEDFTVEQVLRTAEGDLSPVICLGDDPKPCPMKGNCKTYGLWEKFYEMTLDYFSGVTIADLVNEEVFK